MFKDEDLIGTVLEDLIDILSEKKGISADALFELLFGDRSVLDPGVNIVFEACCDYLEMHGVEILYYDDDLYETDPEFSATDLEED